jgi:hypothetical protein
MKERCSMKTILACLVVTLSILISGIAPVSAQLFNITNESSFTINVALAYKDDSCSVGFHNLLWTPVGPASSTQVDIDLSNSVLITAIVEGGGRFTTLALLGTGNLGRYGWDTPLAGSNECALANFNSSEEFGYAQFGSLSSVCPLGIVGVPGILFTDDRSQPLRPSGTVGCIDLHDTAGPVVIEPAVEVP